MLKLETSFLANLFFDCKYYMSIIFISGLKGSGKTTVAEYLSKKYNTTPIAFGDKLKDMIYDLSMIFDFPISSRQDLDNPDTKEVYRKHMQFIGTEICQKYFGKLCWVKQVNVPKTGLTIISDLRFKHELKYFKDKGYKCTILKVVRPLHSYAGAGACAQAHISETLDVMSLETPVIEIVNNGTLEELYQKLDKLIF